MTGYLRKVCAEFLGVFALIFAGCGSIMVDAAYHGAIGHLGICAVFGLVVMAMICALGHISGAHFNPAVTLSFAVIGRFPWKEVPGYVCGQCLASISACSVLGIVLGQMGNFGATVPDISVPSALVLEVILSFVLMCVIAGVATDSRASGVHAGCAIGGTVMFCALMGGPLSGASMNPARTLGPAVFLGDLSFLWLYTLGPICGASLGGVVYQWIRCGGEPLDANGCC